MSVELIEDEELSFEEILQILEEELDRARYTDSDDDSYKELDFND